MKTWLFAWKGRKRFIDAETKWDAEVKFLETYGFFPENCHVSEVV